MDQDKDMRKLSAVPTNTIHIDNAQATTNFFLFGDETSFILALANKSPSINLETDEVSLGLKLINAFVMSPQLVRDLRDKLSEVIEDYENAYGKLPGYTHQDAESEK